MPVIQFHETVDSTTGTVPAKGFLLFRPTRARFAGTQEVLPRSFRVALDVDGKASVPLEETTSEWCWQVQLSIQETPARVEHVAVHADDTQWASLTRVNPEDLSPVTLPTAWAEDNGDGTYTLYF